MVLIPSKELKEAIHVKGNLKPVVGHCRIFEDQKEVVLSKSISEVTIRDAANQDGLQKSGP